MGVMAMEDLYTPITYPALQGPEALERMGRAEFRQPGNMGRQIYSGPAVRPGPSNFVMLGPNDRLEIEQRRRNRGR